MKEAKSLKADIKQACAEMAIYLGHRFPAADFIIVAEGASSVDGRPDAIIAASGGYCCERRISVGLFRAGAMTKQAADEKDLPECFDVETTEVKPS